MDVLGSIAVIIGGVILYIQNHRQTKVSKDVKTSLHENNGGNSVKDRFDALESKVNNLDGKVNGLDTKIDRIEGALINKGVNRD